MGQDGTTVETFFEQFSHAWTLNDGGALAPFFVDDATLINPFGERADGRAAVGAMYTEYFGGMLRGTTTTLTLESVRVVENTHALCDAQQPVYGPDGAPILVVHLTALLRRDGDGWKFVDARPYTTPPLP